MLTLHTDRPSRSVERKGALMKKYPKIETLFERGDDFKVLPNKLKNPVLGTINEWVVTEKIDGTNIRVSLTEEDEIKIGGRTDNAQIHSGLYEHLHDTFTAKKMAKLRLDTDPTEITLYGEGYGAGIQKGGGYRPDKGFILFDARINDQWWLDDDAVTKIAETLGIPRVPIIGHMSLGEIIDYVRNGFSSHVPQAEGVLSEGIVARTVQPLFDARGKRLIIKLKTKDFKNK